MSTLQPNVMRAPEMASIFGIWGLPIHTSSATPELVSRILILLFLSRVAFFYFFLRSGLLDQLRQKQGHALFIPNHAGIGKWNLLKIVTELDSS